MSTIGRQVPTWLKAAILVIVLIVITRAFRSPSDTLFRFQVANNELFAIESGDAYGTEVAVFTTSDEGESWQRMEAPAKTRCLAGNGADLLALTSTHQVWRRTAKGEPWAFVTSLPGTHHYSLAVRRDGRFLVSGVNEVTYHDPDGKLLQRFTPEQIQPGHILFSDFLFLDDSQERVLTEASPFGIHLLYIAGGSLRRWENEMPLAPDGDSGLVRIRRRGEGYIVSSFDGVYATNAEADPLRQIYEFRRGERLDDEFCRDLVACDDDHHWLLASDSGIRLFEDDRQVRSVFSDRTVDPPDSDEHDLILQIVPYGNYYYVSFCRLKDKVIGVRLRRDLSDWEPMRLN